MKRKHIATVTTLFALTIFLSSCFFNFSEDNSLGLFSLSNYNTGSEGESGQTEVSLAEYHGKLFIANGSDFSSGIVAIGIESLTAADGKTVDRGSVHITIANDPQMDSRLADYTAADTPPVINLNGKDLYIMVANTSAAQTITSINLVYKIQYHTDSREDSTYFHVHPYS